MLIGALAQAADISRDTIRFYEKLGLIRGQRQANGYKQYAAADLELINFVKLAQELGFSLAEIHRILPILKGGALAPDMVQAFVEEKMAIIDQRISTLQSLRERLATLTIGTECPLQRDCSDLTTHHSALKLSA